MKRGDIIGVPGDSRRWHLLETPEPQGGRTACRFDLDGDGTYRDTEGRDVSRVTTWVWLGRSDVAGDVTASLRVLGSAPIPSGM